jgi:hypothetical protein
MPSVASRSDAFIVDVDAWSRCEAEFASQSEAWG